MALPLGAAAGWAMVAGSLLTAALGTALAIGLVLARMTGSALSSALSLFEAAVGTVLALWLAAARYLWHGMERLMMGVGGMVAGAAGGAAGWVWSGHHSSMGGNVGDRAYYAMQMPREWPFLLRCNYSGIVVLRSGQFRVGGACSSHIRKVTVLTLACRLLVPLSRVAVTSHVALQSTTFSCMTFMWRSTSNDAHRSHLTPSACLQPLRATCCSPQLPTT